MQGGSVVVEQYDNQLRRVPKSEGRVSKVSSAHRSENPAGKSVNRNIQRVPAVARPRQRR